MGSGGAGGPAAEAHESPGASRHPLRICEFDKPGSDFGGWQDVVRSSIVEGSLRHLVDARVPWILNDRHR
jgi:hypothetical protein